MRTFLRLIFLACKLLLVAALVGWIMLHPGKIQIDWMGYRLHIHLGFAALVLAIAFILFAALYHGWRTLLGWPQLWRKQRRVKALEIGYAALNKGLLAVAAGDGKSAGKQTKKALAYLPEVALTHLLAIQTAQLNKDDVAADTHLAKLMQHPDGQLFALRGQLTRALQREDRTEALRLSRLAYQQQPDQPWIIDTAVQMEARAQNWVQIEKMLRQALRLRNEHEARWKKDLAATLLASSDVARDRNDTDAALHCAREALKYAPDWSPAVVRVAELWQRKTYRRRAQKTLMEAWETAPHPDLVQAWLRVMGAERSTDTTAVIEKLTSVNPDHAESCIAMARAFAKNNLWGIARQHALRALEYRADRGLYTLLAEIERDDTHDTQRVQEWQDKALAAPAEAQWMCQVTFESFEAWQPLNRQLHFNTIVWQVPQASLPPAVSPPQNIFGFIGQA